MNEAPTWGPVAVELARHVDMVCNAFEAACKAGRAGQVEEYVAGATAEERRALLRELIPLEVEYRRRAGAVPARADYLLRFPDEADIIHSVFQARSGPGPDTQARSPGTGQSGPAAPPPPGTPSLAGYEIEGELGRGGMGIVYRARQVELGRRVALKMILAGAQAGPGNLARFLAEARAIASLRHPNIVQIYDIGEHEGLPFFSLELVEGGSLAERFKGARVPARQAAELVETLARAVHVAHQRGIIHRDLTPANVLLTADGVPKIADFGLAKFVGDGLPHGLDVGQTQSGVVVGTPSYMAPEQAGGQSKEISPAADVYSLGAILYTLLTGRPPFRGETVLETLLQVRSREPIPPRRWAPRLSRDLETICLKCLRKTPAQRYPSALDLADDLRRFINYEPIQARPLPLWLHLASKARRRPALSALVLLWVAVMLAGLGLLYQSATGAARERAKLLRESGERLDAFRHLAEQGQEAVVREDWPQAEMQWQRALDRAGEAPAEPDLATQVEELRGRLGQLRRARENYRQFCHCRDTALLFEALRLGLESEASCQKAEKAARSALDLFQLDAASARPARPDFLSRREEMEIEEGCYQLLLIEAEVEASPRSGQDPGERAARALRILDGAAQLARGSRSEQLRRGPDRAFHLRRARYLEQRGEGVARVQELALAARREPESALDFFLMGIEHLHGRKDPKKAAAAFEAALQRQADHFWAQYCLAVCCLQLPRPRPDLANAHLTACLSRRPGFPWGHLLRGFAHSELGEFQAAQADYALAERSPDEEIRYVLLVNRGVLRLRQAEVAADVAGALHSAALAPGAGQPHVALVHLCRQRWLDQAVADFHSARALEPGECMAYLNLARAYSRQGKPELALEQLDQAIQREPGRSDLYSERARVHVQRNDLAAARRDFEEAVRREPGPGPSRTRAANLIELGRLLLRAGQAEEVVEVCEAALAAWPDGAEAERLRALALLQLERYQEGALALERYEKKAAPSAEVYRARGLARAKLGRYAGAVDDYTRALDREPDPAVFAARGWLYLLVYEAPRLALPDFEEAVRRAPENGDGYNGRGYARVLLGRAQEGVADADEALRRGPQEARLYYNAARIFAQAVAVEEARGRGSRGALQKSRDWQLRAVQCLRKALDLCPARQRAAFWQDYVEADAALQPIRRSPGFAPLAAEYQRKRG